MTDAPDNTVAPGESKLNALTTGGFTTDEVNQYRDRVSGTMNAAGFNSKEINDYWGVKTPDMTGVQATAAATPPAPGALGPDNPAMRKEMVGSYERGETKSPNEFVQAALRGILPVIAGGVKNASHPVDMAAGMGTGYANLSKAWVGSMIYPFASTENQQGLLESGIVEPEKNDMQVPGQPNGPELAQAFLKGERTTVGKAMGGIYAGVSSILSPVINSSMQPLPSPSEKAGGSATWGQTVPGFISMGLDLLGLAGAAHVGGEPGIKPKPSPWESAPKAQDFPDAALATNGTHAEAEVSSVLRNIYAEQGIHPAQVVADAKTDPTIAQDLAAGQTPKAYAPSPATQPGASAIETQMAALERQLDSGKGNPDEIKAQMMKLADQRIEELKAEPAKPLFGEEGSTAQVPGTAYEMLSPANLKIDPERFQYKASEAGGVTGGLNGVKKWEPSLANPITAWRSEDGNTYVVNGHQRFDLASRAAGAGQENVQMPARVFNEADGYTPEYMRALGAYQNIAEGSGTAVDAAKILREGAGGLPSNFELPSLPPKSQLVQQAHGLAALDGQSFGMVVNDVVPAGYAAEVGHAIKDPKEQLAAMDILAKSPPSNVNQARIMVQDIKNSGFLQGEQTSLFGENQTAQSLFGERSRIMDNAVKQLRQLKTAFGAATNFEGALTEAGNVLSTESNIKAKETNEKLISALQTDATRRGPISDALTDAARQLKGGQPAAAVTRDFLGRVREINAGATRESLQSGAVTRGNESAPERGTAATGNQRVSAVEGAVKQAKNLIDNPESISPDRLVEKGYQRPDDIVQYQKEGATKQQLFKKASALKDGYVDWVKQVTADIDGAKPYSEGIGGESGVRVKHKEGRIDEKIAEKKGNAGAISDYLGGAIEVKDPAALAKVLQNIADSGKKIIEVEDMMTSDDKLKNDGYRAIHMQVELEPGFSAELQLIPQSIAEIKEGLHPEYRKLRDAEGNETPASEAARDKMIDEYDAAFKKFTGEDFMSHPERGAINLTPRPKITRTAAENKILDKIEIGAKDSAAPWSWDSFYKSAVDKLEPVARAVEGMKTGNTSALTDAYKLMRNMAGNYGRAEQFIENATFDFGTYKNSGKSLKDIFAPVQDDLNGWRAYAASRRAIELEARGIKSGMPLPEAKKVIAVGAKQYEPIFKEINTYQDSLLKYLHDAGVLTTEQLTAMRGANQSYIPFYRVMDDESFGTNGGSKVKNPIKRIKGSERDIIDPIESIVRNTNAYITIAEKNAAIKSFYDLANKQKTPADWFTKEPPVIRPTKVSEAEMETFLKNNGITQMPQDTLTVFRAMRTPLARDQIGFFDNGKWTVLKVDPELAEAFNGTPRAAHGLLFKMIAGPAKMLRYGLVVPEFIIRHLERNTLSATVIGSKSKVPFENLYQGIFSYFKKDEAYQDYLKSGGKVSALSGLSRNDIQDQVQRITNENPDANFLNKAWNIARTPFDVIHAVQQSLENINRLGAYKQAMKGLNVDKANIVDAGYYSRNIAPDPSRIGSQTGLWNAVTALANTEIQHTAQLFDALRYRPIPTLAKGMAYITIPTMINWAVNHNSDAWKETPAWERDAFWIVPAGGYTLRIPKPFFLGFLFGTVPERIADAVAGLDKHGAGLEDMIKDMFEQATPNTIPTALTPILEQITNHSMFRGTPLVPDHLMQQLPEYRYSEYTSELTKALGSMVGKVPYVKNTSMASPIVIDNYLRAWTGALGTYVKDGMDASLRKAGVLPDPLLPAKSLADIPFVKAFVVRYPSAQAASVEHFQESYHDMSMVTNTFKALIKQGQFQQAQSLLQGNPQAFFKLDQINKTINEQNQMIRALYKNPGINPDEKRQLIDGTYMQMIQLSRAGNDLIEALKQPALKTGTK